MNLTRVSSLTVLFTVFASQAFGYSRKLTPHAVPASACNPEGLDLACYDKNHNKITGLKVSLTFDDGPQVSIKQGNGSYRNNTDTIMHELVKLDTPATFFVLGDRFFSDFALPDYPSASSSQIQANLAMVQEMAKLGFRVGSHTYHHIPHRAYDDLIRTKNLVDSFRSPLEEYFSQPQLVRLPYGQCWYKESQATYINRCQNVMDVLAQHKVVHVGWSVDSNDWKEEKQKPGVLHPVLENVTSDLCMSGGGIILFHEAHNQTVDNLSCYVSELRKAGHVFVGLEDDKIKHMKVGSYNLLEAGRNPELIDMIKAIPNENGGPKADVMHSVP